jgi:gamma-glutamyltranspeptidase
MELRASGTRWAIASPHTVATEAGAVAFERGGNALDAALAAAVTLAVSYPHNGGVGGDLFALVHRPDGSSIAVNASGRAPAGVDAAALHARYGATLPEAGPDPITVPGAVSGWAALHAEGARLTWSDAFGAAIALAHGGVAISRSLADELGGRASLLLTDPGMSSVFFAGGEPLPLGTLFRQPALGNTLQTIAEEGPAALYGGRVGERYAAGLQAVGSPMTAEDLARHSADLVAPLISRYRDLDVRVVPPNSQGFALLQMLDLVVRLEIDPDPLGPDAGVLALAFAEANHDRDHHLADADGWAVSLIQSLWDSFGSGILEPETGIIAHDRGNCFTLEPGHPNALAPGKRPFHTLMPVLAHREGRLRAVAGSMGGTSQPQINAHNLIRTMDLGMTAADAVAAPRWTVWNDGAPLATVEGRVPDRTVERLRDAGFGIDILHDLDASVGHAHMILIGADGRFDVGSDPRADGGTLAT